MIIDCNIGMICLKLNWFFYDPSWMLHFSEIVWLLRSSVWVVFNNFLIIDATDRSKISRDQKRLFLALRLYPLSFFANTHFKEPHYGQKDYIADGLLKKIPVTVIGDSIQKKWIWPISGL